MGTGNLLKLSDHVDGVFMEAWLAVAESMLAWGNEEVGSLGVFGLADFADHFVCETSFEWTEWSCEFVYSTLLEFLWDFSWNFSPDYWT